MTSGYSESLNTYFLSRFGEKQVSLRADMSEHTSFKTGGAARLLLQPGSQEETAEAVRLCRELGVPWLVMGNGTNLLVRDEGFDGVVIKMGSRLAQITVDTDKAQLRAQAGALLSAAARAAMESALEGLAFAGGIPGSAGGGTWMNAGAYGGELKDVIREITYIAEDGSIQVMSADEARFSYRHSIFQETGGIILETLFQLRAGCRETIKAQMKELAARRSAKQPVQLPSAGSTFKRPPGRFAGQLIEEAGLSGATIGGAAVSQLHAGFIVNEGAATSEDIIDLIKLVQYTVYDKFGVMLEPEVKII